VLQQYIKPTPREPAMRQVGSDAVREFDNKGIGH
jgi:hypothetical protein